MSDNTNKPILIEQQDSKADKMLDSVLKHVQVVMQESRDTSSNRIESIRDELKEVLEMKIETIQELSNAEVARRLAEMGAAHKVELTTLESRLAEQAVKHKDEVAKINREHTKELDDVTSEFEQEIKELEETHKEKLESVQTYHKIELKHMRESRDSKGRDLNRLKQEMFLQKHADGIVQELGDTIISRTVSDVKSLTGRLPFFNPKKDEVPVIKSLSGNIHILRTEFEADEIKRLANMFVQYTQLKTDASIKADEKSLKEEVKADKKTTKKQSKKTTKKKK